MHYRLLALLCLILGLGFVADVTHSQILKKRASVHDIEMRAEGFTPKNITIQQGETIIFHSADSIEHWPASNIHPSHQIYPEFDPKRPIKPGESWSFVFNKVGDWRFHDHLNEEVTGSITVLPSGTAATSTPDPAIMRAEKVKQILATFKPAQSWENTSIFTAIAGGEEELYYWIADKGPEAVMEKLLSEATARDCHQEAHLIGRISFEINGADTFRHMETACHSGFMHGGMEAFLQEQGTANIQNRIVELCSTFGTPFSNFECLHGMGHGVMAYEDYDLPAALDICKLMPTSYDQSSCYGGAFMENIIVSIGQGVKKDHVTKWLNDDPHFPCDAVDQSWEVQTSCYLMQTSRMLDLNGQSFAKIAPLCRTARPDMVATCFQSFGRDAAGRTVRDAKQSADICKASAGSNMKDCIRGALYSIAEFWAERDTTNPHEFCEQFGKEESTFCFMVYGAYLPSFFADKEKLPAICDKATEAYQRTACRTAAGV